MSTINTVPTVTGSRSIKTLKFPFQLGNVGFPEMENPDDYSFANIVAFILTGKGERIMRADLGIDVNDFVFETMTPIRKVRLANMIGTGIETFVPWVTVKSVTPSQEENADGVGLTIFFDIVYSVGGQDESQQIVYPPAVSR